MAGFGNQTGHLFTIDELTSYLIRALSELEDTAQAGCDSRIPGSGETCGQCGSCSAVKLIDEIDAEAKRRRDAVQRARGDRRGRALMDRTEYKLELSNKIERGQAVGNLYGVGLYVNGCRRGWALPPQESRERAENLVATATFAARMTEMR